VDYDYGTKHKFWAKAKFLTIVAEYYTIWIGDIRQYANRFTFGYSSDITTLWKLKVLARDQRF